MGRGALLIRVVARRGSMRESEHRVAWCAVGPGGERTGTDRDLAVFARSAVKPLQALGSVRAGVLERFELGDRHLALACASHGGGADHVAVVGEVLDACDLAD
ncbi:MAG TPA: asparaginase, partial [Solirubrobacteraceae bacterium]|nr:asparaginase [Solirubrobacteraceae bacterium]